LFAGAHKFPQSMALAVKRKLMKIEFEDNNSNCKVIEHVVRKLPYDDEESERIEKDHLQALMEVSDFDYGDNIGCVISYYGENSDFLGIDRQSIWTQDLEENDLIPISIPINIPANAKRAVVKFSYERDKNGFYYWVGRIAALLVLMLLFSWVFRSFGFFN
jgi:hypothetical protein